MPTSALVATASANASDRNERNRIEPSENIAPCRNREVRPAPQYVSKLALRMQACSLRKLPLQPVQRIGFGPPVPAKISGIPRLFEGPGIPGGLFAKTAPYTEAQMG